MTRRSKKKRSRFRLPAVIHSVVSNWLVRRTTLVLLCFILAVNLAVTLLGASKLHVLSPFHVWNKVQAIELYARHTMNHIGKPPLPESRQALIQAVHRHGVSKQLVFAIARAESGFVSHRVSHTGAMGLMQLMPDTAAELGVKDPFHPAENADGGVRYLARLWKRYRGDVHRIAAAYNYGPGRVPRTGTYAVPNSTRIYVHRVVQYMRLI